MIEHLLSALYYSTLEGFRINVRDGTKYLQTPFLDLDGEFILLAIHEQDGRVLLDDGGRLSSLLFELDQEAGGSPGFKLVQSLTSAHGMTLDFASGTVKRSVEEDSLPQDIWLMAQVIASICQVLPHLDVPQKGHASLGPRLRRRVRATLKDMQVLNFVEQRRRVSGKRVDDWTVDFYYKPPAAPYHVVVNTVDLDVADAIAKAEHVITLALDVMAGDPESSVRVIYDRHAKNSKSEEAAGLIEEYTRLGYHAFDYQSRTQYSEFTSLIQQELHPAAPGWLELRR